MTDTLLKSILSLLSFHSLGAGNGASDEPCRRQGFFKSAQKTDICKMPFACLMYPNTGKTRFLAVQHLQIFVQGKCPQQNVQRGKVAAVGFSVEQRLSRQAKQFCALKSPSYIFQILRKLLHRWRGSLYNPKWWKYSNILKQQRHGKDIRLERWLAMKSDHGWAI